MAAPVIRALGVTDYYLLDTYERVRDAKHRDGRLPGVDLVFPNVELRLAFGTVKGNWVNCHLLVNPQDPDRSCPKAWCSFGGRRAFRIEPGMDQLAAGRLMSGSSLIVAIVSSVM